MSQERETELSGLGAALGQLIAASALTPNPVLAGGLCMLHSNNVVSMVSVEAQDCDAGTLITMSVALLSALATQEEDPRVRTLLQKALKAATEAQIARVTPAINTRMN